MSNSTSDIIHVQLSTEALDADDAQRASLTSAIAKLGPGSTLAQGNPNIAAQVTDVGKTQAAFVLATGVAAASKKQHDLDVAAANTTRVLSNKSLRLLATLLETDATSEEQVTETGMSAYTGRPAEPPFESPLVTTKLGKKGSGKATAVATETGTTRQHFAAQSSPDPYGPTTWSPLTGDGKTRKLTGKSGTSVWVRFALRRGQNLSDWSTPILVTFP